MNDSDRAPIAVFVYNRPDKTKEMMESLKDNSAAGGSELFIFSDAPKTEAAAEKVARVREYIDTIASKGWFRSVTVYKAEKNKGLAASVIEGVTRIINNYGRIIVLEDDLTVSRYFLTYMNECLDGYRDDGRIWSISGYSHNPPRPDGYKENVYLNHRASSWGWGTWKDRWDTVDWEVSDYGSFRYNLPANLRFCIGGNDQPSMLRAQMNGKIDSWAIRWCYAQTKQRKLSVAPVKSLVRNNGMDGSGTNCRDLGENDRESFEPDSELRSWYSPGLKLNNKLVFDFYKRHHLSLYVRVRDKIRELI